MRVVLTTALGIVLLAAIFLFDPSSITMLPCPFYLATGLQCPGCGLTRASHHIVHAHFQLAWNMNPMIFVVAPLGSYLVVRWLALQYWKRKLPDVKLSRSIVVLFPVLLIFFFLIRNYSTFIQFIDRGLYGVSH